MDEGILREKGWIINKGVVRRRDEGGRRGKGEKQSPRVVTQLRRWLARLRGRIIISALDAMAAGGKFASKVYRHTVVVFQFRAALRPVLLEVQRLVLNMNSMKPPSRTTTAWSHKAATSQPRI